MTEKYFEEDPSAAKKVLDMLTVANDYCLFVEASEKYRKQDVAEYLLKISPLLYLKGSLLPRITPAEEYSERYVTEEQWETVFQSLKKVLGKEDYYSGHFFTEEIESDEDKLSLSENFADVYQDLKDFVMLYQKRTFTAKENAVFQCYSLFISHWGPRLLESLPKLHQIVFNPTLSHESQTENEDNLW